VAERLAIDVFKPLTEDLGQWVLRAQRTTRPRLFRRANSALAFGDPGVPFHALDRVREFYAAHDRAPLLQVERDGQWEQPVLDLGWQDDGGNEMWVVGISQALRRIASGQRVVISTDDDEAVAWKQDQAEGRALVSGDWLCIHDVFVEPEYRGQYLATAIVSELLEWGAERGATHRVDACGEQQYARDQPLRQLGIHASPRKSLSATSQLSSTAPELRINRGALSQQSSPAKRSSSKSLPEAGQATPWRSGRTPHPISHCQGCLTTQRRGRQR
jgi:GNAT superfamily N-acetyltransferase